MLCINVVFDIRRYLCIEMNKEISKNLKYSSLYIYILQWIINIRLFLKFSPIKGNLFYSITFYFKETRKESTNSNTQYLSDKLKRSCSKS